MKIGNTILTFMSVLTSNSMAIKLLENNINIGAKIILVSSMYGIVAPSPKLYKGVPQANPPRSYGAAKAGVIQLTKYLSAWLTSKINVNCISELFHLILSGNDCQMSL